MTIMANISIYKYFPNVAVGRVLISVELDGFARIFAVVSTIKVRGHHADWHVSYKLQLQISRGLVN